MPDETPNRPAGTTDGRGHPGGGGGEHSPLQARAAFFKNRSWESVVGFNRGACARGGAQHGINSETGAACAAEWNALRSQSLTLDEIFNRLRGFHRQAPFLFFNGNTFATIGRELSFALFSDLVPGRKREVGSAVAHYIAGVLDHDAMAQMIDSLCQSAAFQVGDRVKTLRGSLHGQIAQILDDGRVVWRADGTENELTALPESLIQEE